MEGENLQPLAFRMCPRNLDEYIGQEHIIGQGRLLRRAIQADQLSSVIFYGPPGTGKSQTITNIIANALYHGKRVLFVSEKMAALEVVQSRLDKIGIGAFCLELHSNSATKAHVLKQLDDVLGVKHIVPAKEFDKSSEALFARRKELISYIDALHTKASNGLSVYDCITRSLSFGGPTIQLPIEVVSSATADNIPDTVEMIEGLDTILSIIGNPKNHPLAGLEVNDCTSEVRNALEASFDRLSGLLEAGISSLQTYSAAAAEPMVDSYEEIQRIIRVLQALTERNDLRESLSSRYTESVFREDPRLLKRQWDAECSKGFITKFLGQRQFVSRLKIYSPGLTKAGVPAFIRDLEEYSVKDKAVSDNLKRMDDGSARRCLQTLVSLEKEVKSLVRICKVSLSSDKPFCKLLLDAVNRWKGGLDDLRNWYLWCYSPPLRHEGFRRYHHYER